MIKESSESFKKAVSYGKYYLLERLAVGGMAEIFKAKQVGARGFEKHLVIKRILPHLSEDPEFVVMFEDEAKIAAQLSHANIVQIYDLGEIDSSLYIAMEYLDGRNLRDVTRQAKNRGLKLSIEMASYITIEVCKGLDYAHRKKDSNNHDLGIIHRDISPQNIFLSHEGEVKILDFGIAKAKSQANKTEAGILKGKFGYMSPEQAAGKEINQQTDIYAAGVILYELLTEKRLFSGKSDFEKLEKVKKGDVSAPSLLNPDIPHALDQIVLKALAKDPAKRYQSAADFQTDLSRFLYSTGSEFTSLTLSIFMKTIFSKELSDKTKDERVAQPAEGSPPETASTEKLPGQETKSAKSMRGTLTDALEITQSDVRITEQTLSKSQRITIGKPLLTRAILILIAIALAGAALYALLTPKVRAPAQPPQAAATTYSLELNTDPPGAFIKKSDNTLFLDENENPGKTPYLYRYPASEEGKTQEISFVLQGYEPLQVELTLNHNQPPGPHKLVALTATLILDIAPPGCDVELNGRPVEGPRLANLEAGEYRLTISKENYETIHSVITLKKGENRTFQKILQKLPAKKTDHEITITGVPSNSDVFINNQPAGKTGEKGTLILKQTEGSKNIEIKVSKDGFETYQRTLPEISKPEMVKFHLIEKARKAPKEKPPVPAPTWLPKEQPKAAPPNVEPGIVNIRPPAGQSFVFIRIDNKNRGTAPGKSATNIELKPGAHVVICTDPSRTQSKTHTLTITGNDHIDFTCNVE